MDRKPKKIGLVLNECECLMMCLCPVCGRRHLIHTDLDDLIGKPVVEYYEEFDDIWELCCPVCDKRAALIFGENNMIELLKEGELELYEDYAKAAALLLG